VQLIFLALARDELAEAKGCGRLAQRIPEQLKTDKP
jgi:hypothetical protein